MGSSLGIVEKRRELREVGEVKVRRVEGRREGRRAKEEAGRGEMAATRKTGKMQPPSS